MITDLSMLPTKQSESIVVRNQTALVAKITAPTENVFLKSFVSSLLRVMKFLNEHNIYDIGNI